MLDESGRCSEVKGKGYRHGENAGARKQEGDQNVQKVSRIIARKITVIQ